MDISAIVRDIKTGRATLVCFPVEMTELKLALGLREEDDLEYIIADSSCPMVKEYDSINTINDFVKKVEDVDDIIVLAVHEVTGYNIKDVIDYDFDFTVCSLLPDVNTSRELGEYWFNELGSEGIGKENIETYFDYQAFGRDIAIESEGGFTSHGYLEIGG
ncbi:TPA: antirestriction protein ArdA [Streptococcus agalactiae]|nr:antirestriction protein ArdA [Streptococcus agalactiae]HEM9598135.1 antirestriction protein ArdA [Streptococcus agalactiae]HEM9635028.1 antirestriction protein ArdA [Streptococcus agalactiae]